jgi:hypothetical protein
MNRRRRHVVVSVLRVGVAVLGVVGVAVVCYALWRPGLDITDGRDDRGSNAVWIAHGWLGGDDWFITTRKTNEFARYRSPVSIQALGEKLRRHHITDVFPHLCPVEPTGQLPAVSAQQVERFLDAMEGFRVLPWIGGPNGAIVRLNDPRWRSNFVGSARTLLAQHPRLAGVQVNIEPLTSGDPDFLLLLDELSVAAYPPPTRWHPFPDVHWDEAYFRAIARRCDQFAVMMYDAAQRIPKTYQRLMADWTVEVLNWSQGTPVLLGVPTYDDAGLDYHDPKVENLTNGLLGIHRGLSRRPRPTNYQGVAIYCEWEMSDSEWEYFSDHFLKR